MKLNVTVNYEGAPAQYVISPDKNGIYKANLLRYEGSSTIKPPGQLFLLKGSTRWTGNVEHPQLLNELGTLIETNLRSEDFLFPNGIDRIHTERQNIFSPEARQQRKS